MLLSPGWCGAEAHANVDQGASGTVSSHHKVFPATMDGVATVNHSVTAMRHQMSSYKAVSSGQAHWGHRRALVTGCGLDFRLLDQSL